MIFGSVDLGLTAEQEAERARLRAVWSAETDPTKKAAAWKAIVAYDTSLPPPPVPAQPAPKGASPPVTLPPPVTSFSPASFFDEHKTAILAGSGVAIAVGLGYWYLHSRKRQR